MIRLADNEADCVVDAPEGSTAATVYDGAGKEVGGYAVTDGKITVPRSDIPLYDRYLIGWDSGDQGWVERVQRRYLTPAEVKEEIKTLSSTVDPTEAIYNVEGLFDRAARRSFCLKGKRDTFIAEKHGDQHLYLTESDVKEVYSVTVNGEDAAYLFDECRVLLSANKGDAIKVHFSYGLEQEPYQLRHCALLYIKTTLGSNGVNPRATGQENDFGYFRLSVAGRDGPTGIPEVDAFLSPNASSGGWGIAPMMAF